MIVKPNFANRLLWFIRLHPGRKTPYLYSKNGDAIYGLLNELNNRHANRLLFLLTVLGYAVTVFILTILR